MNPICQQIRLAMARAGIATARDLAGAIGADINLTQRKLSGSRPWTLSDLETIANTTGHRIELRPEASP
ncbi:MAG: helix-turn-helix domain-containing protein [Acidobacteria bacterium]|nr:helix-turn-helix domain-containing protein [Acidobacteriota bacterium]